MAAEVFARAKAGEVVRFEWENRRSDGKPLPVDVTVRFARLEGDERYVVICRDLTERRQVEALRQDALDRFRQLTQLVPGVVYQFRLRPDGSSCMPYVSGAFRQMFGLSANEVREDATKALMRAHPDDVEGLMASIQMSAKDMTPWQHEYRLKFDDGTERWVFGNSLPQRDVDGSVLWHGFITDITERKQAEAALIESEERWKFALEGAGEGVWDWNIQTGDAVYSRRWKRGDHHFRIYVLLKPDALDRLYRSREFKRTRDRTIFHIGYPINFRQQGGAPSMQVSLTRTGRRADININSDRPAARPLCSTAT